MYYTAKTRPPKKRKTTALEHLQRHLARLTPDQIEENEEIRSEIGDLQHRHQTAKKYPIPSDVQKLIARYYK